MLVIAGLGNPGARYARNRHNIGFMAVDAIAGGSRFGPFRARHQGLTADGLIGEERVMLLKPQTYMNDSGRSVGEALRYAKLDLGALVVIHDELDTPSSEPRNSGFSRRMPGSMGLYGPGSERLPLCQSQQDQILLSRYGHCFGD